MVKKIPAFSWAVIAFLILCSVYLGYASLQLKKAKVDLENYRNAPICDDSPNCRHIVQVMVLESYTARSVNTFKIGRYKSTTAIRSLAYKVSLRLSNFKVQEATILPNLNLEEFSFDIPVVSLSDYNNQFVDLAGYYFPQSSNVHVEMWNGKPTLLYSRYIKETEEFLQSGQYIFSSSENVPAGNLDTTDEDAVPTTHHPLIFERQLQDDLNAFFNFVLFSVVIIVALKLVFKR